MVQADGGENALDLLRPYRPGGAGTVLLAAEAVSAAIAQNHTYGDGLYAVCDYLGQAHRDLRRDLDRCLDQARAAQSLPQ